jgi:hypothetical protein
LSSASSSSSFFRFIVFIVDVNIISRNIIAMLENELGDGNASLHECVLKSPSNIISWDGYKRDAEEYTHQWNRVPFQMRTQELGHNILKKESSSKA